jgi:hypothetical protein
MAIPADEFSPRAHPARRGLGLDKPLINAGSLPNRHIPATEGRMDGSR